MLCHREQFIYLEMHSRSHQLINWICHHLGTDIKRFSIYTSIIDCYGKNQLLNNLNKLSKQSEVNKSIGLRHFSCPIASATTKDSKHTPDDSNKKDDKLPPHEQQQQIQQERQRLSPTPTPSHQQLFHNNHSLNSTQTLLDDLSTDKLQSGQGNPIRDSVSSECQRNREQIVTDDGGNTNNFNFRDKGKSTFHEEETNSTTTTSIASSTVTNHQSCPHNAVHQKPNSLPFKDIPGPRPSLPFIGTNWIYFPVVGHYKSMKLHEANMDKYHRYGPIMKEEYQRGYPTVTIFDPSDIREVFMREGACPSRPVLPYVIKHRQSDPSRYPNVGLANMEGQEWFELRSRLAPLLLSRELKKRHISTQNRVSSRLVNYIKSLLPAVDNVKNHSGIVDNIQEVFYRFSMESIMNLCINQELGCLKATDGDTFNAALSDGELIFQAAMNFFEAQHKLYYGLGTWKYVNSKAYRQLRDSQNAIHDIASKYIDLALVHLKKKRETKPMSQTQSEEEHESLLETLHCTNKFNDLEIKSTIVDFVGGGIYTVANTLTMVLFLLASNPSVQEQLYQEICQVFHEEDEIGSDINIDMDKLEQLKYLKRCLKESYRLLPTIPGVARTLQRDMVLSNYLVPKNTLVFCNFMVTCRLPQYFENPDEYNPNRWDRNGKTRNDLAFCLLPFGHGVRKCIGHNFAELEIYVALAKLIRSFKISTTNGEDAKSLNLCYKFIVVPEKPVKLEFTPRRPL